MQIIERYLVFYCIWRVIQRDTGKLYNSEIQCVSVIKEGNPNQLFVQEMQLLEDYEDIRKWFVEGEQKDNSAKEITRCKSYLLFDQLIYFVVRLKSSKWEYIAWNGTKYGEGKQKNTFTNWKANKGWLKIKCLHISNRGLAQYSKRWIFVSVIFFLPGFSFTNIHDS